MANLKNEKEQEQYDINKKKVLDLFYRTELRLGEKIIDNKDTTIMTELNLKIWDVRRVLTIEYETRINKHWKKINSKRFKENWFKKS